jgi:hypothetical protein
MIGHLPYNLLLLTENYLATFIISLSYSDPCVLSHGTFCTSIVHSCIRVVAILPSVNYQTRSASFRQDCFIGFTVAAIWILIPMFSSFFAPLLYRFVELCLCFLLLGVSPCLECQAFPTPVRVNLLLSLRL